jgi:hypothetical protein
MAVEKVDSTTQVTETSYEEPKMELATQAETAQATPTDDGRDTKVGEHLMLASMRRAEILNTNYTNGAALSPDGQGQGTNAPKTFTEDSKVPEYVNPGEGKLGPDATPQEAATYIRGLEFGISGNYRDAQAQFFTQSLKEHQGNPEWTQQFFRALGTEKTAELIGHTVTPGIYQYSSESRMNEDIATVRNAITELAQRPDLFTQGDMNQLVGKMADRNFNPWVASEIFGKMDYRAENVKNMFFHAAVDKALDPKTDKGKAVQIAAAASHVLAQTSMDNQALQLNRLRQENQLGGFIENAMKGPQEHPTLRSVVDSINRWSPVQNERYGRVEGLLLNISVADVRDGHSGPMPISSDDLHAVRTQMFNSAAYALTDQRAEANFKDNAMFKDAMSSIFMSEFDSIMNSGLGSNGAGFDILKFQPGMEKFFQQVLFSPNPSHSSRTLSNFLSNKMTEMGQALYDTSPDAEQKFRDKFGRSRMDGAAITGGLMGMLTNSLKVANDDLKKNAEAQAEGVKFVVGLAFSFIPGAGTKLGAGVTNAIAKTIIEKTFDGIQGKVLDLIKEGATNQAKQMILDQYKNKDPQVMLFGLFNALNQTIPNGDEPGEQNFLTQFQSSYGTAVNSPYRITK